MRSGFQVSWQVYTLMGRRGPRSTLAQGRLRASLGEVIGLILSEANPSPRPPPRSGEGEKDDPSPQPPPRSGEGETDDPSPRPPPRSGEGETECSLLLPCEGR